MMLQHLGPSLADISCSALVPCLSPPGELTLEDFTNFTPIVKEELRQVIQNKRLSCGLSADASSDSASSASDQAPPTHESGVKRELTLEEHDRKKRRRERNKIAAAKCRSKKKEKTEGLQKATDRPGLVFVDDTRRRRRGSGLMETTRGEGLDLGHMDTHCPWQTQLDRHRIDHLHNLERTDEPRRHSQCGGLHGRGQLL
ncbi:cyclic AMP-dependent transcription factor ATF-3 isoform X3 [Oryzias latipes]